MVKARAVIGALLLVLVVCGLVWAQNNANETYLGRIEGLKDAVGVAVDGMGNLYVAHGKRLSHISSDGTVLNSKPLGFEPTFVKVDAEGRVYLGKGSHSLNKPSPTPIGEVLVFDGGLNYLYSLGSGSGEFLTPSDLDFDSQGNIYVSDVEADVVKVFASDGSFLYSFGQHGKGDGFFNEPSALAIDNINGVIYIADRQLQPDPQASGQYFAASRIHVYTLDGQFLRAFGNYDADGLISPTGLALYGGRLYASDSYLPVVQVFDPQSGQFLYSVLDDPANGQSSMRANSDLAISGSGILYISSAGSDAVYIFGINGYVDFSVSPDSLSFDAQAGNINPPSAQINITATGQGDLVWTASSDQPWVILSETSGTVVAGGSTTVDVTVEPAGLQPGQYEAQISISASGITKTVQVALTVHEPAVLSVTPQSLTFTATFGSDNPPSQFIDVTLSNALPNAVWTAISDSSWLSVNPVQAGPGSTTSVVSVNTAGLSPGVYTGQITINSDGATGSPSVVTVTLNLIAAGTINVQTNLDEATFTITGPSGVQYQGSGKDWSVTGVPDGVYTVVFNKVSGYITPSPQSETLSGGGVINFSGQYQPVPVRLIVAPDKGGDKTIKVFGTDGSLVAQFVGMAKGMDIASGDLDGDGLSEVVAGSMDSSRVMVFSPTGQVLVDTKLFGKSKGVLVAVGDLDGDGVNELVGVDSSKSTIKVYNLTTSGLSAWSVEFDGFDQKVKALEMTLADTDGDGAQEVVLVKGGGKRSHALMRVWKVVPDGAVLVSETSLGGRHIKAITSADINSDGIDDVILYDGKKVKLTDGSELMNLEEVSDMVAFDLDGDAVEELLFGKKDGTVAIYELDGTAVGSFSANSDDKGLSVSAGLLGY